MAKESDIVSRIMKHLKSCGGVVYNNHGSAYGRRGRPDLEFHMNGQTLFIEAKKPGELPTRIQVEEHRKLRRAGMPVVVATSVADVEIALEEMA